MSERGFACIALVNPKTPANFGGCMRAAHIFGAAIVVVGGVRLDRAMARAATNTTLACRHIPTIAAPDNDVLAVAPYDCEAVAIEIADGARDLPRFHHPERATYIFGPEDGSIPAATLKRCKYVVRIPSRFCLNLAAAVNVVLYDRVAKEART